MRVAKLPGVAVLLSVAIGCSESQPPLPPDAAARDGSVATNRDGAAPDLAPDRPVTPPDPAPDAAPLPPPTTNLPAPWKHDDIGEVGAAGASTLTDGVYRVSGAGTDIWAAADGFSYVWRPFAGDGEIVAQVTSLAQTDVWAKAGVMFRESTSATAPHADMLVTADNGTVLQFRTLDGDITQNEQASFARPPRWLRLTRQGNVITGSFSSDGMTWAVIGRTEMNLPADILVGLAVSSHVVGASTEAVFENVVIKSYPPYPPGLDAGAAPDAGQGGDAADAPALPPGPPLAPWTTGDIGVVGIPGSVTQAGGTFTVTASGIDIWGTADSFRYVFQPIAGNAEVIARVVSLVPTDMWAKAGVMMRATLDPGSVHVDVVATNPNGTRAQWRPAAAAITTGAGAEFLGPPPMWVRLVRTGNTVDGYGSNDGVNWVLIYSATDIPLPPVVYVGLAVTSHNNTTPTAAILDNVTVKGTPAPPPDGGGSSGDRPDGAGGDTSAGN